MNNFIKIILIILGVIGILILIFRNYNLNYVEREEKLLRKIGMVEKQAKLPDGSIINYGEYKNDKKPLVLIHGQMTSWEDYVLVLEELSRDYHVFAIDCYGHGGSSKNPEKYPIIENGKDIIWFIENIIRENVIISGHSSGGLLATWVSANAAHLIDGLVIEDAPFFATEEGRAEKTFAGQGFKLINDFYQSGEESYTRYNLEHNYMKNFFNEDGNDNWKKIVYDPAIKYLEKHPGEIPKVWYYPNFLGINEIYKLTGNLQEGNGDYDLRFGLMFYDYSWFDDFNQEKTLRNVKCPSVLLHVAKPKNFDSYYDKNGILASAMDENDASRVDRLLVNNHFIDNIEGSMHNIHRDRPEVFIEAVRIVDEMG